MRAKEQLGEFLRRRRELLSPLDAGLPVLTRRRTPGLRRDEVADLASMSTRYYERLEQGHGPQPSTGVLARVSDALLTLLVILILISRPFLHLEKLRFRLRVRTDLQ